MLRHGHTYVTMKRFDLLRYCQLVAEFSVERSYIVPPIILQLAKMGRVGEDGEAAVDYLASLRMVISAAAPLSTEVEEAFRARHPQCAIKQCWGMSELAPFGTYTPDTAVLLGGEAGKQKPQRERPGTIGVAVANTDWRLIATGPEAEEAAGGSGDAADFAVVPVGERGELCIRGPQVMVGYRDDQAKTDECLGRREEGQESGWLRTGDVAIADDEGYLRIV